jgi:cytochrome c biogenesis protein
VHALAIRAGATSVTLRPGESHRFAEGTLRYEGLRMWMGYTVSYDWTIPWLFAACVLAVAALGWHFAVKFRRRPWLGAAGGEGA